MANLNSWGPPTIATMAESWRGRARYHLQEAIREWRLVDNNNYAYCDRHLGEASAAVSVLYDLGHEHAYEASRRYQAVRDRLTRDRL